MKHALFESLRWLRSMQAAQALRPVQPAQPAQPAQPEHSAPGLQRGSALTTIGAAVLLGLAACSGSSTRKIENDNQATLASLPKVGPKVQADAGVAPSEDRTIAAYKDFLKAVPNAPQRAEALRRLGDLEMDRADRIAGDSDDTVTLPLPAPAPAPAPAPVAGAGAAASAAGSNNGAPDYQAAMARYREFLTNYPNDPRNDRVLYQLARAQEQSGNLEGALQTLTRLVTRYPGTVYADEAHFRQGELLFTTGKYKAAESAYAEVLQGSNQRSPFYERSLYMQGWSLFKQGRLEDSLKPFFSVLDLKLGSLNARDRDEADLANVAQLKRADRELVDDTFRVVSISLSNLQGDAGIPRYIDSRVREGYQFRVYQQLAELYIKQERVKDAADTYAAFVNRDPLHAQAPLLQARVVEILEAGGLPLRALGAKKDHVLRYGAQSEFRKANATGWERAQPLVKAHLTDLAQHYHAIAQKTKARADVDEAVRWYRTLLTDFEDDDNAPAQRFLLAELLFENQRWASAASEYEAVAYALPKRTSQAPSPRGADAGYAALLSYAEQEKALDKEPPKDGVNAANAKALRAELQAQSIDSALRFAKAYPQDPRNGAVLTRTAEVLFAGGKGEQGTAVARQVLGLNPPAKPEVRRTAWRVVALDAFERNQFAEAEKAFGEVLALTPEPGAARNDIIERQAAAIYKQGEQARGTGQARAAVGHFERIAALGGLATGSTVRANAQYDAAAALIGLKDWDGAARALEDFRRQQPSNPLQSEVPAKLALAYLELGRSTQAANELERVAAASKDNNIARSARLQAAELHDKAASLPSPAPARSPLLANAIQAYEKYVQLYPQPVETAIVARSRLAALSRQDGQPNKALAWTQAVQQADAAAGDQRTPRTRSLAALAALSLAEPMAESYRAVALVEPLQKQLKLKRDKLEELQKLYAQATEIAGGASPEVTTRATYLTGVLFQDFGRALLASVRPKKLNKVELEQYNVLLEEQAFPFEEKAIELFETNARRTSSGLYDASVKSSFAELAKLKPVRYAKTEKAEANLPTDMAALQRLLQDDPRSATLLNQVGVVHRQAGRFEQARQSYEAAIAIAPNNAAPQFNLAILFDMYLGEPTRAVPLYQRCVELLPAEATLINRWLAELKTRKPAPAAASATSRPALRLAAANMSPTKTPAPSAKEL
jgi:cellulose synthase operon protein C